MITALPVCFRVEVTSRLGQTQGQDADVRAQALHALHRGLGLGAGAARTHRGRLLRAEPRPGGGHPPSRAVSIHCVHIANTVNTLSV